MHLCLHPWASIVSKNLLEVLCEVFETYNKNILESAVEDT